MRERDEAEYGMADVQDHKYKMNYWSNIEDMKICQSKKTDDEIRGDQNYQSGRY